MENNIEKSLEKLYWDELKKEGIEKEDVEFVDLDIAFSPVTPMQGAEACEVTETMGGKYIVHHPLYMDRAVSAEILKVMRYRYLMFDPSRIAQRNHINNLFRK